MAVLAGLVCGLFLLMVLAAPERSAESVLALAAISGAFLVTGVVAIATRHVWPLAAAWAAALALLLGGSGDWSLMDGGAVLFPVFFFLLFGLLFAVMGFWRRSGVRREPRQTA